MDSSAAEYLNCGPTDGLPHPTPGRGAAWPDAVAAGLAVGTRTLTRILDILDYAVVVLAPDEQVLFANRQARRELVLGRPLFLRHGRIALDERQDAAEWRRALAGAHRAGRQSFVVLADGTSDALSLSVMPLALPTEEVVTLLVVGRGQPCATLSREAYARRHGLTPKELEVLTDLCGGLRPPEIARRRGLQLCTVRTHVSHLRMKTGARDIDDLLSRVHRLPPLASVLA